MRKLIIAIVCSFSWAAHAEESILYSKEVTTTPEQIKTLQKTIVAIPSNDPKVNAIELNKKLKEMNLPLLDVDSPDLRGAPSQIIGTMGSFQVGAEMSDGKHTYCLPCIDGWNYQRFGVYSVPSEKELFESNKKLTANAFGECQYDLNVTSINKIAKDACGKSVDICDMTAICSKGARITSSCVAPNGLCPKDPLDCMAARSIVAGKVGASAIGDSNFPQKASQPAKVPAVK